MDLELMFPFYKEAKVIKSYNVEEFDLTTDRFIFEPVTNEYLISAANEYFKDKKRLFKIYRIMPNDVYIVGSQDPMIKYYLCNDGRPSKIKAQVTELDYGRLVRQELSVEEIDGKLFATKKLLRGYDARPIISEQFIESAMADESVVLESLNESVDFLVKESKKTEKYIKALSEHLTEAFSDDLTGAVDQHDLSDFYNPQPYKLVLEHYFTSKTPTEKIPLLVGISGIAKSATVKSLCDKFDYRLVDLRVSFLSRLDVDGMVEITDTGEGGNVGDPAPTAEFLTCTDEYLAFARGMKDKIEEKIKETEEGIEVSSGDPEKARIHQTVLAAVGKTDDTGEKLKALRKIYAKFDKISRTPVLFLDEITRSDKSIRGALTTIINQRLYGSRNLRECRIVAATNAPVGYKPGEDRENPMRQSYFEKHFLVDNLKDVAVLDRFDKLLMTPDDVYPEWIQWAKSPKDYKDPVTGKMVKGGDLHNLIMEFIETNGGLDVAYDLSPIDEGQGAEEQEAQVELPIVQATFRAWSKMSDYLKILEGKDEDDPRHMAITPLLVSGLIGEKLGDTFIKFLLANGWKKFVPSEEDSDPMNAIIDECLECGFPLSIVGASGLGKTARVMRYAKNKRGHEVELIPLSTKSRLDIMGVPTTVSLVDWIVEGDDPEGVLKSDPDFTATVAELRDETGIRERITQRAPQGDLLRRIQKCIETNTPLVLFFDEFNRSIDPMTQTAIFQAISDNEFAGVKFPPGLIKVVLAGNPGDDKTGEAGEIDLALIARTVHFRRLGYIPSDVDDFFKFSKKDAWEEIERDSAAPKWEEPETEDKGYEKGAKVNHTNKTWKSLMHKNIIPPGEWSSGMSKVLIEYLENNRDDVLGFMKAVEEGAIDNNTTSTRSLKMLSDLIDNYSVDNTLNGSLLLPNQNDRDHWGDQAGGDDDIFRELLTKISKRIDNWSALDSGYAYVSRGKSHDLKETVEEWKREYKAFIRGDFSLGDKERVDLYTVTTNFLEIDDKLKIARQKLLETKVDADFAGKFLEYYNNLSGKNLTIEDIKNEEVIDDYLDQVASEVGGMSEFKKGWAEKVIEIYDYHGVNVNYETVLNYFSRNLILDDFKRGLEKLIIDDTGSMVIKTIEAGMVADLKASSYDPKIIENHPIYKLIVALGYDAPLVRSFIARIKETDKDIEKDDLGYHGLGESSE